MTRNEVKVGMTVCDARTGRVGVVTDLKFRYGRLIFDFFVSWEGGESERAPASRLIRWKSGGAKPKGKR